MWEVSISHYFEHITTTAIQNNFSGSWLLMGPCCIRELWSWTQTLEERVLCSDTVEWEG